MDIQLIEYLAGMPINIVLMAAVVYLWRELRELQNKYEQVLLDMGKLNGKVDTEVNIDRKLEQILSVITKPKK